MVADVKDRNAELGECFEKSVEFKSFENGVLTWESCANEECKKVLRHGFPAIKQLVRELFGFETQIKHSLCSKEIKPDEELVKETVPEPVHQTSVEQPQIQESFQEPVEQQNIQENIPEPVQNIADEEIQKIQQSTINGPQSTSMVEDAEMGGSASCVTNCESSDDTPELNPPDIREDPMVAKAIELFEANKITIQSKI